MFLSKALFFLKITQISGAFFRDENFEPDSFARFNAKLLRQLDIVIIFQCLTKFYRLVVIFNKKISPIVAEYLQDAGIRHCFHRSHFCQTYR